MAGTLRPPKAQVYRSFLYLDGDEVINSLSALEGGDVDEVLVRTATEGGGEVGGELGAGPVKGRVGKKKSQRFEEEVLRKRTEHSAATLLLRKLHDQEAIGVVDGDYGPEVYPQLHEHMLLEFRAEIRVHPLHQVVSAARGWLKAAPALGVGREDMRSMTQVVKVLETIASPGGSERTFLAFAETTGTRQGHKLIVPIQERHLLVDLDSFAGSATFVAQVDRVIPPDDEVLAVRLIRNAPQLSIERQGIEEALPELIDGFSELGIEVSREDFFLRAPAVILKPICIFK